MSLLSGNPPPARGVGEMEEWMRLPVSQIKKLVKSRAGRIAELQMEVKILEGIMEKKVREGDLGGSAPRQAAQKQEKPKPAQEMPQKKVPAKGGPEEATSPEAQEPEQTKITRASSDHAFREID
jgi:hypothetical protein